MDVSIIIVNYNVKEFVYNSIQSILKSSSNFSFEIIIVDNNSEDGSVEYLTSKFSDNPNIKIIANDYNAGFGKANNQGAAISKGNYLLLINPDTLIQEDTITKMVTFFEKNKYAGLAGCKILNPDGSLQLACRRSFPSPWVSFTKISGLSALFPKSKLFAKYNLTYLDENITSEVDAISGSFMFMPSSVFKKINGFDEDFFMYGEDLDLCYRVQKLGYKVFYYPETQIIHYKGESTKRSSIDENKVFYDAMTIFVNKHMVSSVIINFILRFAITLKSLITYLNKNLIIFLSILLDFVLFNSSLYLSSVIYGLFNKSWHGFPSVNNSIIYTFPAILHILTALLFKVYKKESLSVLKNITAVFFSFFLITFFSFFFKEFAYSRAVLILNFFLTNVFLSLWRVSYKIIQLRNKSKFGIRRNLVIIGTSQNAIKIANRLKLDSSGEYQVLGLIGNNNSEVGMKIEGYEIIGSLDSIQKSIREVKIDEIILSNEELTYEKMILIVSSCNNESVEFKLVGSELDFLVGKSSVSALTDLPLISFTYNISKPIQKFLKRIFDIAFSLFSLVFFYPIIKIILRPTDEIFKLINEIPKVLSGKMSFVGPKNESNKSNLYLGKKGLTGFWYIENADEQDLEKLDIYYAKNQSLWLDIEILSRTVQKLLNVKK